jgi:hypothetical protein
MPLVNDLEGGDKITNPLFWICDEITILGLSLYNYKRQNVVLTISKEKSP